MFAYITLPDGTYKLVQGDSADTGVVGHSARTPRYTLLPNGVMCLHVGFIWNGPSGGAIDTASAMEASAYHDAAYDAIKRGLLPGKLQGRFDKMYRVMMKKNSVRITRKPGTWIPGGVAFARRWAHWGVLRLFGRIHRRL